MIEKILKSGMIALWLVLLAGAAIYSFIFTFSLLAEVNGFFPSLVVIATSIFCWLGVINILKRMFD